MSRLCVLICRMDDEQQLDHLTELHRIEVPALEVAQLAEGRALEHLEQQTLATGQEVMRRLLVAQWQAVEAPLVADYQAFFPSGEGGPRRP